MSSVKAPTVNLELWMRSTTVLVQTPVMKVSHGL